MEVFRKAYKEGYDAGEAKSKTGPDAWTILSALSPLIIGAITSGLIIWQISVMNGLNKLTKQSADAATDAAKASIAGVELQKAISEAASADTKASIETSKRIAEAAIRSAEVSEKALILTERPWIIHTEQGSTIKNDVNHVLVAIANTGHGPAFLESWGALAYVETLPAPEIVFADLKKAKSFGAVMPGQQPIRIETAIPNRDVWGVVPVWLVSLVCYSDIHGNMHETCDIRMCEGGVKHYFPVSSDACVKRSPMNSRSFRPSGVRTRPWLQPPW